MPGAIRSRVVPRTCRSAGSPRSGNPSPATPSSWPRVGTVTEVVRRRFEVNDGIVGWGQGAFAALPHLVDTPLDWRGPYPAMPAGGYAAPGDAGLLGILPGQLGSGPDRGGGFGAEPDRRHRPVAARDRDPGRPGGSQPVDHGAIGTARCRWRGRRRGGHDVPGNRLAARRRAPPDAADRRHRARRFRRVRGGSRAGVPGAPGAGAPRGRSATRAARWAGGRRPTRRHRRRRGSSTSRWRRTRGSRSARTGSRRAAFRLTAREGGSAGSSSSRCARRRGGSTSRSWTP